MQPPYSSGGYRISLDETGLADLAAIDCEDERKKYFENLFERPYEAYDFLGGKTAHFCTCADMEKVDDALDFDVLDTVLKAVIAKGGAYPEELVCFLLEAHADYHVDLKYLLGLPELPLAEMPVAESYLWTLSEEEHAGLLARLCKHYGLHDYMAERLEWLMEKLSEEDRDDPIVKDVILQCLDNGIQDAPAVVLHSYRDCRETFLSGDHYAAIERLAGFQSRYPGVLVVDVVGMLAKCYVAVGWNYFAVQLIDNCMRRYPEAEGLEEIYLDSFSINRPQVEVIKKRLDAGRWSENCSDIMAVTELMYRYYGKMMPDYGSLANGFGRAVETELREKFYEPVIKTLVASSTLVVDRRKVMLVYGPGNREVHFSEPKALGSWALLFNQGNYQQQFDMENTFFNLFAKCFGDYVRHTNFGKKIQELGLDILRLNNIRCDGSHEVLKDWDKVKKARELALRILDQYVILLRLSRAPAV